MNFRVGQKVARWRDAVVNDDQQPYPAIGEPCTVVAVHTHTSTMYGTNSVIELAEYPCPAREVGALRYGPGFFAVHFRPIVERKTDISIFTAMLTPSPERVS